MNDNKPIIVSQKEFDELSPGENNDKINEQEVSTQGNDYNYTEFDVDLISPDQSDKEEFRGIVTSLFQDNDLSWLFIPGEKETEIESSNAKRLSQFNKNDAFAPITADFFHSVFDSQDMDENFLPSSNMKGTKNNSITSNCLSPDKEKKIWISISNKLQESLVPAISDLSLFDKKKYFLPETLKTNFELYFLTFHDHFPILHKASFKKDPQKIPPLLLMSIIILGTLKGDEESYFISIKIHEKLMWMVFSNPDLIPSKLWILQTLALVQAFAKMGSTRHQHEISATFHSAIITILKRNGSCTNMRKPRHKEKNQNMELKLKWELWIEQESIKRVVFLFFVMDSQHSVLFGHAPSMSVTEIMLELPCSEEMWDLDLWFDWNKHQESQIGSQPPLFLDLLKSLMDDQPLPVTISSYSKLIMLHGLLAVIWSFVREEPRSFKIENQESLQNRTEKDLRKMNILTRAIETWSYSLLNRMPSKAIEASSTLYRITYLTLFTSKSSILEILTFCGSPSLMGRPMTKSDKIKAFESVENWAKSFEATHCVIHALLLIQRIIILPDRSYIPITTSSTYSAANDDIVFRPWCLYITTLVVWSYCFFANNKTFAQIDEDNVPHSIVAEQFMVDMIRSLKKSVRLKDNTGTIQFPNLNKCRSLIIVVKESLKNCRWEMLNDAHIFLDDLIRNWDTFKNRNIRQHF